MDQDKISGKGIAREEEKVVHQSATTDDIKHDVSTIPAIEEPKFQEPSLGANVFAGTRHGETRDDGRPIKSPKLKREIPDPEEEFLVEKVVDSVINDRIKFYGEELGFLKDYYVKWKGIKGYPDPENTWEPEEKVLKDPKGQDAISAFYVEKERRRKRKEKHALKKSRKKARTEGLLIKVEPFVPDLAGETGHFARKCNENDGGNRPGGGGHGHGHGRNDQRSDDRSCYNCKKTGHISPDCPEERRGCGGGVITVRNAGHSAVFDDLELDLD